MYITSYLRGIALDAVRPLLLSTTPSYNMSTTLNFVAYLKANFGDPDEKGTARQRLRALRQTGMVSEYFSRFRELIAILGWVDQEPIVDKAMEGLLFYEGRSRSKWTQILNSRVADPIYRPVGQSNSITGQ